MLPTNPKDLAKHTRKLVKVKQILLDLVKDHLIPHIADRKMAKNMYDVKSPCTTVRMFTLVQDFTNCSREWSVILCASER